MRSIIMGGGHSSIECLQRRPVVIHWRGRRYRIAQVNGRWRLGGRWWEGEDEAWFYRVSTREGAVADLCFRPRAKQWTLHRFHH